MTRKTPARSALAIAALSILATQSCATSNAAQTPGVTPREAGCAIELLREGAPTQNVRLIANVRARCTGDIAADTARCERLLMDEGCRRGAQVLWQYRSAPMEGGEDGIVLSASAGMYP